MASGRYLSLPAASAGKSPASAASAWGYGAWVEIVPSLEGGIYVTGFAFQITNIPALDTTVEQLFEISTGAAGSESLEIQIPYSFRMDTAIGYYLTKTLNVYFPEPMFIAAGSRVAVRAADSLVTAITYGGVKLMYREGNSPTVALNTPTDGYTVSSTTPTLNFTGTDIEAANTIEYNVQIDTVNTFDSGAGGLVNTWDLAYASYSGKSKSIAAQEVTPTEVSFSADGTKMYVMGVANQTIYQYTLSTAWDVSTATYATKSYSVTARDTFPMGMFFKPDGTKMYMVGITNDTVYQHSLSTAWDISTTTYDTKSFSVTAQDTFPYGIFFKSDGLQMWMVGEQNDRVNHYVLSVAWDVSTASFTASDYFSVTTQEPTPYTISFDPTGVSMFVAGWTNDNVNQYTLSTAWDVKTATYTKNFPVGANEGFTYGLYFKPDGTKMYQIGEANDTVWQYDIGSAAPLITAYSGTDAGFTAGHPFTSGNAVDYTVQSALPTPLANNTYYWRVAGIDLAESGTYGAWSATRSFIVPEPPFVISGTSNQTTGTVKVAVNATLDNTHTGTIAGDGTWSISGVTKPASGDSITVFISNAAAADVSTAVTTYSGSGAIDGMVLNRHVLSIGSTPTRSIVLSDLAKYDYDQDTTHILHSTNGSPATLLMDPGSLYTDENISILTGNTLTIGATETLTTYDLTINGILASSGASTYNVKHNWVNNGTFTASTSTVALNGTTQQALSGTLNSTSAFYNLTITNNSGASASDNERTGFTPSVDFNAAAKITNNYTITTANVRVEYQSGATYEFANINWNGQAAGTRIYFRNSDTSTTWLVKVTGTQTAVSYINVSRSDASVSGGSAISSFDGTDYDAGNNTSWFFTNTRVRQEINLFAGSFSSVNSVPVKTLLSLSRINQNTVYSGTTTGYFEIVAINNDSSTKTIELRNWVGDAVLGSVAVPNGTSSPTKFRSNSFALPGSSTTVYSYIPQTTSAAQVVVNAARLIAFQDLGGNPLTATETQIEIGNYEVGKINTVAAALTYPKYWVYNASNWDGTKTFYAEATFSTNSLVRTVTVILQSDTAGDLNFVTNVVTVVNAQSSTTIDAPVLPARVSFTPVDGCNYRIVASISNAASSYNIYNAKIIVSQTGVVNKLEPQYLLLNTYNNTTGIKNFKTSWGTTDWTSCNNTYYHEINSSSDTADAAKLQGQFITKFNYWANTTSKSFNLLLIDSSNVLQYKSPLITPTATGSQSYIPANPVSFVTGWSIGLYCPAGGLITFDNTGASASYTNTSYGDPSVGSTMSWAGSTARTYNINGVDASNAILVGNSIISRGLFDSVWTDFAIKDINNNATASLQDVANSSATGIAYRSRSAALLMPTSTALDTYISNVPIYASRIIVRLNNLPVVTLNTPTNGQNVTYTAPTLNFTGSSPASSTLEYNVQIDTVNTFSSIVDSDSDVFDSYPYQNVAGWINTSNTVFGVGQTFLGNGDVLSKASFRLNKTGAPTGSVYAYLYAHTGTFGSTGVPTGAALAISGAVAITSFISDSMVDFDFSYALVTLTNGTPYVIVMTYNNGSAVNMIGVAVDNSAPSHVGNYVQYTTVWAPSTTYDVIFYVYNPVRGPLLDKSSTIILDDTYNESNASGSTAMYGASYTRVGQSFISKGGMLNSCKFSLYKQLSPTGNANATLYEHTGTYGNGGMPVNQLAISDNVDVSTLPPSGSPGLITFTFSGANRFSMETGKMYFIVLEYTGGNSTNYVGIQSDSTAPTHGGQCATYANTFVWATQAADVIFYVYIGNNDTGFTAGHPFASGGAVNYAVQKSIIDRYSESYYNNSFAVSTASGFTGHDEAVGQSFTNQSDSKLVSCKFYMQKNGAPSGSAYAKLYAHSGTYGVDGVPTGAVLATSDALNVTTVSTTSFQLTTFTFSGANQYVMAPNTYYVIVMEYTGGDSSNYMLIGVSWLVGHSGVSCYYDGTSWGASVSYDTCFYVYASYVDESLVAGTYYWRTRAIAAAGGSGYGDWSSTNSFTIILPTASLNTPTNAQIIADKTPTFDFTGTDLNADDIEYNVQVDRVNTFDSFGTVWDVSTATLLTTRSYHETEATSAYDVTFSPDGTKMYILAANRSTYQYKLSTAWDVSTAAYNGKSHNQTDDSSPYSVDFSSDGRRMYIMGVSNDRVYQYNLSICWDVSTALLASSFSVTTQDSSPMDMAFSSDGTKMYIMGSTNDTVYQYTLATGWDISTASYASKSFYAAQDTGPSAVAFNSDGTKMYIMGNANDTVYQYTLGTGWDVSTASYAAKSYYEMQEINPLGLVLSSDGTKMYVVGAVNDTVYQYAISGPLIDKVSIKDTGFVNPDVAADIHPFISGDNIQHTLQNKISILDAYSESNYAGSQYSVSSGGNKGVGQSFIGNGQRISSASFYLRKSNTPTGNAVAKVYAHTGTFHTDGIPTGSALATSDNFWVGGLTSLFQIKNLTFSGANNIVLANGTYYVLTIEFSGGGGINTLDVAADTTSPTCIGNGSYQNSSSVWIGGAVGIIFYLYSASEPLSAGTYYWRVRSTSISVSNIYGAWSSTRSFTVSGMSTWNGSGWDYKPVKYYNGSTWVQKPVKVWNGTSWVIK